MSDTRSPYSEPVQAESPRFGSSRNTVVIIAIISATILALCGGLIGLGFYAVDRLANQISEFGDTADEQEATAALEFALEQNVDIQERVGKIEQIEPAMDLTYHEDAGAQDYYYRIRGSLGEVLVVVRFDDDDHRWFRSVELVDGDGIEDPRSRLSARHAPFDSQWSKRVYDILAADENSLAQRLEIGPVLWTAYDYQASSQRNSENELLFEIQGESGAVSIVARFDDTKFTTVQSLHLVGDDDTLQKTIYTADSKTSSDPE